jgi:hypothetical protein
VLRGLTARRDYASSEQEKSAPALDACSDHLFSPPLLACPSHKLVSTRNSHHHTLPLSLYPTVPPLPCFSPSPAFLLQPCAFLVPCSAALPDTQHTAVHPSPLLLCCWLARPLLPSSFLLPPSSNRPSCGAACLTTHNTPSVSPLFVPSSFLLPPSSSPSPPLRPTPDAPSALPSSPPPF